MTPPSIDSQGAYWGEWAIKSQRMEGQGDPYIDQVCQLVRDAASRCPRSGSAVEVGCGTGFITRVLTSCFAQVWGIEIAQASLEVARQNAPGADLVLGDFLATSNLPAERDFVVSCDVLAHVADQREFFARCRGVLKVGGRLLLITQNPVTWRRTRYVSPPNPNQLRHWLGRAEIREHCQAVGLRIVRESSLMPHGDTGLLWWRPYANGILRRIIGRPATHRLFERLGLGRSIIVEAVAV